MVLSPTQSCYHRDTRSPTLTTKSCWLPGVAALAIALAAVKIGQRPADDVRTFGYRRFEILAAAFNALLLFLVAAYVLWEGVGRLLEPPPVGSTGMLVIAVLGLAVNLIAMRILSAGKDASLNLKGAYLEVWADMVGSLGVIVGAVVIMLTGWGWVDPVVAIAIAGLLVNIAAAWVLSRATGSLNTRGAFLHVLGDHLINAARKVEPVPVQGL